MSTISRPLTIAIALVSFPMLSGCLSGAVSLAGNVVEGAVNVTGDIAEGAVDRVTTSDDEKMKKDWKKSRKEKKG